MYVELPDIFHPKIMNGEKGVIPSSTYSSTGWFVMNYYNGATCNNIVFTSGQVVNTCFEIGGGQSAKYQISSSELIACVHASPTNFYLRSAGDPGDCSTAMVEIFSTIGCTGTATTVPGSSFGVSGTCSTDTDDTSMSYKNTCSTNSNYNFGVDGAQAK